VLDVASHPVLEAHVLNGRPVLPMALILEYLAHGAVHQNPGLTFHGCNDFRILHGVVLEDSQPLNLRVGAGKAIKNQGGFIAPVELRTFRADGAETLNARAEVLLTATLPTAPQPAIDSAAVASQAYLHEPETIYRDCLFHGPDLQGIVQVMGHSERGIAALVQTAPPPGNWICNPMRQQWQTDPMVVDCGFQLTILWTQQQRGASSLPCYVARYRQYRRSYPDGNIRVVIHVTRSGELHAIADVEFLDAEGRLVARMDGYECVTDPGLQRAFARRVMVTS
jgi:hypothetical protein